VAVFVLSFHADYLCRHSGQCCTAGWRIPVEPACEDQLVASGLAASVGGDTAFERSHGVTVLALDRGGACAYFTRESLEAPASCVVHSRLGHDALPSACRHFPRVAVTDDTGTFVTLSHFCPTAAAMLFRDDVDVAIVEAPASFRSVLEYEGLDARGALPPALSPVMLMDLDGHHAWERHVVQTLSNPAHTAESALEQLAYDADALCDWRPGSGSLGAHIASLDTGRVGRAGDGTRHPAIDAAVHLHEMVRSCVPAGLGTAPAPMNLDRADAAYVQPAWGRTLAAPIRRYLAARAFASWVPWQGRGVVSTVAALAAARAVLRVEAGRQCGLAARVLDQSLLIEAFRQADLLLVHKASSQALADALAAVDPADVGATGVGRDRTHIQEGHHGFHPSR
jgi:hypothetical protein